MDQPTLHHPPSDPTTDLNRQDFAISPSAIRRLATILADEPSGTMLRISVTGGGCSGFQYNFTYDHTTTDDDHAFHHDGVTVIIDDMSLDLLRGSHLDFVEELIGASFVIKNPNAATACGCGNSFSI